MSDSDSDSFKDSNDKKGLKNDSKKKKKRISKLEKTLPNKIIAFKNKDKEFHEHWHGRRNMLNLPHPFRAIFVAKPNCGKTNLIMNVIMRQKPEFEQIFIIHCDKDTKEYTDIGEVLDSIPDPAEWDASVKKLVVIDDAAIGYLIQDKKQASNLDRMCGYASTHKSISVIISSQDFYGIPKICRRTANVFVLWKMTDSQSMKSISRRIGMQANRLEQIFAQTVKSTYDFIMIDGTNGSPYPLRLNAFTKIDVEEI